MSTFLGYEAAVKHQNPYVSGTITPATTTPDASLTPDAYRWFRRDELVRRCIITNASVACFAAGFETELEAADENLSEEEKAAIVEQFSYVKAYVDQINKQVNLDNILFIAQVKRSIYGKAAFEIVLDKKGAPDWLLSLQSTKLKALVSDDWTLKGFDYNGELNKYKAQEVLYFVNLQLENDYVGIDEVEPVTAVCTARYNLLKRDFPEITRSLWAPYVILNADTTGLSKTDATTFLDNAVLMVNAGKSLAFNRSVQAQVVDQNINLAGLVQLMDKLDHIIIRNFATPRFLLNEPQVNRATAYAEFEAYVSGKIAEIQRYFKRALEAQWYERLVKLALKAGGYVGDVPVRVKHRWKIIRSSDYNDLINAVNVLYGQGFGLLGEHPDLCFDMLGLDKKVLETKQPRQEEEKPDKPDTTEETPRTEQQETEETVDEQSPA